MAIIGFILCLVITAVAAVLLLRKYNPQGVLLLSGILMVALGAILGLSPVDVQKSTGTVVFDIIRYVEEKFISNFSRAGLQIMVIGGYVAFMNKIEATNMMVHLAVKPLSFLKKAPYVAAVLAIPIGQLLFITTPSAAGVGLLLVATLYPILVNLGVSKITALSAIAFATLFDQGPGSANTLAASGLADLTTVQYFVEYQVPRVIPTTVLLMVVFYFYNRWADKRDVKAGKDIYGPRMDEAQKPDVPGYFALLPVLPILFLLLFSGYVGIKDVNISTTVAMICSLLISLVCVFVRKRNFRDLLSLFKDFFQGMGKVFAGVVSLIVCAEVFSGGLISLGFIDTLVSGTSKLGAGAIAITVIISIIIFMAAMLMGSGNAAFFSFGPLIPGIASKLGISSVKMIVPMQLSASMGRAASPIAGVIVAICEVAGVSPVDLAKRNTAPLVVGVIVLITIHFILI